MPFTGSQGRRENLIPREAEFLAITGKIATQGAVIGVYLNSEPVSDSGPVVVVVVPLSPPPVMATRMVTTPTVATVAVVVSPVACTTEDVALVGGRAQVT